MVVISVPQLNFDLHDHRVSVSFDETKCVAEVPDFELPGIKRLHLCLRRWFSMINKW